MRICLFDLETWDLSPEFGPIICASFKSLPSGDLVTFRQDTYIEEGQAEDMVDDRALCIDIRDKLEDHHLLVAWHGKGFDVPLLNSRLALHDERCIERRLFIDPMYAFRGWRGLKPRSSSLKNVARFFDLEEQKMDVGAEEWLRARLGQKKACDIAQERCESDVRVMEEIYWEAMDRRLVKNISGYP